MDSTDSDLDTWTTYEQDISIEKHRRENHENHLRHEQEREQRFQILSQTKDHDIFKFLGMNIEKFTSKKINFTFIPSLVYPNISKTYQFHGSLKYQERNKKWIVHKEPMPAIPLFEKVTEGEIFIDDDLDDIFKVLMQILKELRLWSKDEISFRLKRYKRFKKGELSYVELDGVDEELLTDEERHQVHEKREAVLRRMIPPEQRRVT